MSRSCVIVLTVQSLALAAQMPVVLIVHLTWTTYRRFPMIGESEAAFLRRFLPAGAMRLGVRVLAIGLVQDHVHLILRLPARYDLPRLVQELKGASARLANRDQSISRAGLRWAEGYHANSVSPRNLRVAIEYVRHQATRHPDRAIRARDGVGFAG
jgi:putative transposase